MYVAAAARHPTRQKTYLLPPTTCPPTLTCTRAVSILTFTLDSYGDDMTGTTTTLCVRRATYWDEEMGKEDPAKKGVCSNYLCDANPGMKLKLTGPSGKVMLMPEDKPETDLIMVATGTGIAPYRSFARRLFAEATPAREAYKGQAWLFLGVANSDALLYDAEWQQYLKEFPDNFRLDYALSREQTNKDGGKMYIQDKVGGRCGVRVVVFRSCVCDRGGAAAVSLIVCGSLLGGIIIKSVQLFRRLFPFLSPQEGTTTLTLNLFLPSVLYPHVSYLLYRMYVCICMTGGGVRRRGVRQAQQGRAHLLLRS